MPKILASCLDALLNRTAWENLEARLCAIIPQIMLSWIKSIYKQK